jgi:ribonuclease T2
MFKRLQLSENRRLKSLMPGPRALAIAAALGALVAPGAARAQVKASGILVASSVCEATKKLDSDNPGNIRTGIGERYEIRGVNKEAATHYLILVPDAPVTETRWVGTECGDAEGLVVQSGDGSGGSTFRLVTVSGDFLAKKACPALTRTDAAPDGRFITTDGLYGLIARDADRSFFQIRVPDAGKRKNRWVAADCGTADITYDADGSVPISLDTIELTLAASWQPGFCATASGQTNEGCTSITPGEPATRQFSLHGLWPDDLNTVAIFPCNCHLPEGPTSCFKNAERKEPVELSAALADALDTAMPGSRGDLENHEWTKHGTCHERHRSGPEAGSDDDEYFTDSLNLLAQLNASPVRELFETRIGGELTADEVFETFDAAFGTGAGDRVQVICNKSADGTRTVIQELYIGLGGPVDPSADLATLIQAAPPRSESTTQLPCGKGEVAGWPN